MKPTARRRLGKYVLLGRLGAGGMGKIYLAHQPGPAGIDKLLVVKRLHSHLTGDPVLVNSFLDEARLSMALNHPNIVHTYDVGDVDGRTFMVMEYIDGQNLGVVLRTAKRSGQYPKSSLWGGLFLGVLDGLHAAHVAKDARGRPLQIIHRDVSPQNVLVTYEGMPKLVDFGIAKAAMRVSETDAGTLKGKYAYMSPEQVRGEQLDARSDVFAAGIVLWEMLAGRRLYKAETIVRSVERILTEPPVSPQRVNPACDEHLAQVTLKALQKDREQRYASAEAMKDALEDALAAGGHRYRPSDARELMQRLFKDLIEKQRAVLEASLNDSAIAGEEVDEDDPRRAGDSQSDLRMPQLRVVAGPEANESTTPSAMRRSPLVTAEGDDSRSQARPDDRAAGTAVARRREGSGGKQRATPPPAPTGRTSSSRPAPPVHAAEPGARETHDVDDGAPWSSAPAAVTATHPSHLAAEPSRRRRAAALLVGALLAGGVVAGVVVAGRSEPVPAHPGATSDAGAATSAATTGPGDAGVARGGDGGTVGIVGIVGIVGVGGAGAAAEIVDAGAAPGAADASPALPSTPTAAPTTPRDGLRPAPEGTSPRPLARPGQLATPRPTGPTGTQRPAAQAPEKVPDRATDRAPDRAPEKLPERAPDQADEGFLTLDTVPWTTVYLGKKRLGETPLVKVPVPAGELELLLVNPDEGIKESYVARVKRGEIFRTRLDLR